MSDTTALIALRTELQAAMLAILPQINGLQDLGRIPAPDNVTRVIGRQLEAHQQRQGLMQAVLDALQDLEDDGYPVLEMILIEAQVLDQIDAELADLEAAVTLLKQSRGVAATVAVDLGTAQAKPD